jgi:NtrC-family two-component system response regulator AlgB
MTAVATAQEGLRAATTDTFDLAFVDLQIGEDSGLDLIPTLREQCPWMKVVLVTGHASIESAVEALKRGAADYITKPFQPLQVRVLAQRQAEVRRLERRVDVLEADAGRASPSPYLESANPDMKRALDTARKVADTDATVLLTGESGTGKGVLARAIHEWSRRSSEEFSVINCPSLTAELLRSELFGHVRGAFTGAVSSNPGKISVTDGGTLFLDEIGDMPGVIQPQLLRFIQDREYERLGETRTRSADVRILAATNRDLERLVQDGEFREDLSYRLRVIEIEIPPLRERKEDIPPLASQFLEFFAARHGRPVVGFSDEAAAFLTDYDWPGNARELRNAVERAAILAEGEELGIHLFPQAGSAVAAVGTTLPVGEGLMSLEQMEAKYIEYVLEKTDSIEKAAEVLDIAPSTLWRRRRKYEI